MTENEMTSNDSTEPTPTTATAASSPDPSGDPLIEQSIDVEGTDSTAAVRGETSHRIQ